MNRTPDSEKMSLICGVCGLQITSKKANLYRHMDLHGPVVARLECPICNKTCSNKYNLKIHCIRKHSDENISLEQMISSAINTSERAKGIFIYSLLDLKKQIFIFVLSNSQSYGAFWMCTVWIWERCKAHKIQNRQNMVNSKFLMDWTIHLFWNSRWYACNQPASSNQQSDCSIHIFC